TFPVLETIISGHRLESLCQIYFGVEAAFGTTDPVGIGAGTAKNGGTDCVAVASDGPLGFSKRNSCIASPAQKLAGSWVRLGSHIRRGRSLRLFVFSIYSCDGRAG